MTDTTYPLLNLAAEIRAYCQTNGYFHNRVAALAGVSHSFIDKLVAESDPIYTRRLACIARVLGVLGYTIADFDPRITEDKVRQACTTIRKMRDRDCMLSPIAGYLGLEGGSGTLTVCLDAVAQGKYLNMAYDKAICLVHALEPEFEQWCTLYAKRCADKNLFAKLGGRERSNVIPQRDITERSLGKGPGNNPKFDPDDPDTPMRILRMKHRDAIKMVEKSQNAKLDKNPDARKRQMFKLMYNIGFDSFADFCTYTDGDEPIITWLTETGLYRCELTWDRYKAWYRKDGNPELEFPSTDRDIRVWHTLSHYDLAYVAE